MHPKILFIIFFSIFLTLYGLVNYYIFIRFWHVIPSVMPARIVFIILFLFLSTSFIGGRILERFKICMVSDLTIWTGSFWLAFMLYLFIGLVLTDMMRLGFHFVSAHTVTSGLEWFRRTSVLLILIVSSILVLAGYINAANPRIRYLEIPIQKHTGISVLNIVMVSDIHCGTLIGNSRLENMVKKINKLNPDIVLLAGDIVDEDLRPVIEENIGATLRNIRAADGVYAITGNHEYIGGVEKAVNYMEEHGIKVLRDRRVFIKGNYYIIGREDRSIDRFIGRKRKKLETLMEGINKNLPVILMDHQPYMLEEAAQQNVDLQLSGHTHHGQLWPFNLLTEGIYEISWGHAVKDKTNYYVSCGFGTWGPPVRIGNSPEIVNIRIKFR